MLGYLTPSGPLGLTSLTFGLVCSRSAIDASIIALAYSQPSPYMHPMQDVVPSAVSAAVSIDTMI